MRDRREGSHTRGGMLGGGSHCERSLMRRWLLQAAPLVKYLQRALLLLASTSEVA